MKTEHAIDLCLDSRRSRCLSKSTIDTYDWALTEMAEMNPDEPPQAKDELQRILKVNSGLSPALLRTIWHEPPYFGVGQYVRACVLTSCRSYPSR